MGGLEEFRLSSRVPHGRYGACSMTSTDFTATSPVVVAAERPEPDALRSFMPTLHQNVSGLFSPGPRGSMLALSDVSVEAWRMPSNVASTGCASGTFEFIPGSVPGTVFWMTGGESLRRSDVPNVHT